MKTSASIDANGQLRLHEHERWTKWLAQRKGQGVEVEARDQKACRSSQQNRFWWSVVVPLVAEQWGRERETLIPREFVHDALVTAFGGETKDTPLGRARRSSTDMTIEEFSQMIERTSEYLKDQYGSVLPSPEEWSE